MVVTRYVRFYSDEEITLIADRIDFLVKRGRIVHLRPETAWLVEKAVRAYAARPSRQEIQKLFCSVPNCEMGKCMRCMGNANAVMRLYEPWRD
jgi:hypothetical protein